MAQVVNGDFAQGLSDWTITEHGGVAVPGTVVAPTGNALMLEGDSFLVFLEQTFTVPPNAARLSFTLEIDPGFDTTTDMIADVFEARLLDSDRASLVPVWRQGGTAFFNYEQNDTSHTADGVTWDGTRASVDISTLPSGSLATISFGLVNGDRGLATAVRVDDVVVEQPNDPPLADAGDDQTVACGDTVTLDGGGSTDPEGGPLEFEWTDQTGTQVGNTETVDVLPEGLGDFTYTLLVRDNLLASGTDDVVITVVDEDAPLSNAPVADVTVEEVACAADVPDLTLSWDVTDVCDPALTITQDPPAGTDIPLDTPTTVVLTAMDASGNMVDTSAVVVITDLDGSCAPIVHTGDTGPDDTTDTGVTVGTADTGPDTDILVATADTGPDTDLGTADTGPDTDLGTADTGPDTDADTDQGDTDRGDTDPDTPDTDPIDTDPIDTDFNPDPTPDDNGGGEGEDPLDVKGSCGCTGTGPAPATPLLAGLLMLLVRRRRGFRGTQVLLALLAALLVGGEARADDLPYPAFDTLTASNLAQDDEVDTFFFTATEGQAIFIDIVQASDFRNQRWTLLDRWDRVVASDDRLEDSGVIFLMGGAYRWQVTGVASSYQFAIYDRQTATFDESLDVAFSGEIDKPKNLNIHRFTVPTDRTVYVDLTSASSATSLSWVLRETGSLALDSHCCTIEDSGRMSLKAGDYTLEISSDGTGTGTYTYTIHTVTDEVGALAIGDLVSGEIAHPGQYDDYTFEGTAGQCIAIDTVTSSNTNGIIWQLLDPYGNTLEITNSFSDEGRYCLVSDTYTLRVRGESNWDDTGTYEFSIVEVNDIFGSFNFGDTVSGSIDTTAMVAEYTFTATAGQEIYFLDQGSSNVNGLNWRLEHVDGRLVANWSNSLGWAGPYILTAGDHVIKIRGEGFAKGDFSFKLQERSVVTRTTGIGSTISDGIVQPGQEVHYTFFANPGQGIVLDLIQGVDTGSGNYRLYDAQERLVFSSNSLSDTDPIWLTGGQYRLEVVPEGSRTLTWIVDMVDQGTTGWTAVGTPVSLDVPLTTEVLPANFTNFYQFDITQPTQVFFDNLLDSDPDLQRRLWSPAGRVIFDHEHWFDWQDSGPYDLAAGTYTLEFYRQSTDTHPIDYGFEIVTVQNDNDVYTLGDIIADTLPTRGGVAGYTFVVPNSQRLYFNAFSGTSNTDWILVDPVGQQRFRSELWFDWQDVGPITLTPGTWTITVDAVGDDQTDYSWQITQPVATSYSIAKDQLVSNNTVTPGDSATYFFDADEGDIVYFDIINGFDATWSLYDPAGQFRWRSDMNFDWQDVNAMALVAGTWRLEIEPDDDAVGDWEFHIETVVDESLTAVLDTDHFENVDSSGGTDYWSFTLAEDTRVYFDILLGTSGADWRLSDGVGDVKFGFSSMSGSSSNQGPFDLTAGDYTLAVRSDDGDTPDYGFRIHTVNDQLFTAEYNVPIPGEITGPGAIDTYEFEVTPDNDGLAVFFDLLQGASTLDWAVFDEVGMAVFGYSDAANTDSNDRGSYRLADGTYTVVFNPTNRNFMDYSFRILAALTGAEELLYTRNSGTPNVRSLQYLITDDTFLTALRDNVASVPEADGMLVAPDGSVIVAGRDEGVFVVDRETGSYQQFATNGGNAHHIALDPSGNTVWIGGEPGNLIEMPINPPSDGLPANLTGDDLAITHITWDRAGTVWYTSSDADGRGNFGILEMAGMRTVRIFTDFPAHTLAFDPFTNDLFIFGDNTITQWDTEALAVKSTLVIPNERLDGGTVDGEGHLFVTANSGNLVYVDIRDTRLVGDPETVVFNTGIDANTDSIAPISWLGSGCTGEPVLTDMQPLEGSAVAVGEVLISGSVQLPSPTRPVSNIIVGGRPGTGPDGAGQFWGTVDVQLGEQLVDIEVIDRCGSTTLQYRLVGIEAPDPTDDLAELTGLAEFTFTGTTWGTDNTVLTSDLVVTNDSELGWAGPIWFAVGSDLSPAITFNDADGTMDNGLPYVELIPAGETVAPGDSLDLATLTFDNPTRVPNHFTPHLFGQRNRDPYFLSAPQIQVAAGTPWIYRPVVVDPDGDPLTYSLPRGASDAVITPDTGEVVWIPDASDAGLHEFLIEVSDGRGGTATQTFVLYVATVVTNRPPVFVSVPVVEAQIGVPYAYDSHAIDLDGDTLTYRLPPGGSPAGAIIGASDGIVTWTVPLPGTHDFLIEVDDGNGAIASQTFQVSVGLPPPNQNPFINTTPTVDVEQNTLYVYQPFAIDPDREGSDPPLVWELVQGPVGMQLDTVTGRVIWTPTVADLGTHIVNISVTDFEGGVGRQNWLLVVNDGPPNQPPVFDTVPLTAGIVGALWRYDARAVDPEAGVVTYSLVDGPPGLTLVDPLAGIFEWTPAPGDGGIHPVIIRAEDPEGLGSNQGWDIEVRDGNLAPVITASTPDDAIAGALWQFDVDAVDPEDDDVEYRLISGPSGMFIDDVTGLVGWFPSQGQIGTHTFTVRAIDSFLDFDDETWTVNVVPDLVAPQVLLDIDSDGCVGSVVDVCVRASDDVGIASRSLTVDGALEPLGSDSCTQLVALFPVSWNLVANAVDVGGNEATASQVLTQNECP